MSDLPTVYKQVSDRTYFGKLAKMIFILVNVLMAIMFFHNARGAPGPADGIGAQLGFGLANLMLLIFWGFLNVVIGSVVFLTRRKRLVRVEDLLTLKRREKRFRDQESIRVSIVGLVAWICGSAVIGNWIATVVGLVTGAIILWFFYRGRGARFIEEISDADRNTPPVRSTLSSFGRRGAAHMTPGKPPDGEILR